MNFSDPEHLTRLFSYMRMNNHAAILEAERGLLKEEIRTMELERDAAFASIVAAYEPELTERRNRLNEIEGKIAGEQVSLFGVVQLTDNFKEGMKIAVKCGTDFDATNGPVKDSAFNAAMNYAAKYPPPQEPTGPVIPCSTDNVKDNEKEEKTDGFKSTFNALSDWLESNPEAMYQVPKNAQVVTQDGQTFFVFKSAGYKAIAERLGFLYRPMLDGSKGYMLTPKEYDEVFAKHQKAVKYRKEMKDFKL